MPLSTLWHEETGQDLIEYSLLIAFVVVAAASFFSLSRDSIKGIVNTSTSQLKVANQIGGS